MNLECRCYYACVNDYSLHSCSCFSPSLNTSSCTGTRLCRGEIKAFEYNSCGAIFPSRIWIKVRKWSRHLRTASITTPATMTTVIVIPYGYCWGGYNNTLNIALLAFFLRKFTASGLVFFKVPSHWLEKLMSTSQNPYQKIILRELWFQPRVSKGLRWISIHVYE